MEGLAAIWPQGGAFTFSALDGETNFSEPFYAIGMKDGMGWHFCSKPEITLTLNVGEAVLISTEGQANFCFADCWRCSTRYEQYEGVVQGAFCDQYSMMISVDFEFLPDGIFPYLSNGTHGCCIDDRLDVYELDAGWLAAFSAPANSKRCFGIAVSYTSRQQAEQRARAACRADLTDTMDARLEFYKAIAPPDWLAGGMLCTYFKAASVQKSNIQNPPPDFPYRYALPTTTTARCLQQWDTVFHSLGLQHNNSELALDVIRALISRQLPNGYIPPVSVSGEDQTMAQNIHPPLLAWTVTHLSERTMKLEFLNQTYPGIVRYIEWIDAHRQQHNGLYGWCLEQTEQTARGAESMMCESPRFDHVSQMTAVDLSSYMASEFFALEKIARCLDKTEESRNWQQRRMHLADLINKHLWDDEERFYYDLDEYGEFVRVKTTAGFTPLLGLVPDRDRAEALRVHLMNSNRFWSPVPVCSVSQDEATYGREAWRGCMWCSFNVLIYYGLLAYGFLPEARRLARATMTEVMRGYLENGCLYQYYDSAGATFSTLDESENASDNTRDFHTTAAAYIHLAHELGQ